MTQGDRPRSQQQCRGNDVVVPIFTSGNPTTKLLKRGKNRHLYAIFLLGVATLACLTFLSASLVREAHVIQLGHTDERSDILKHVNPFLGTGGDGHTYPGASAPFGSVQVSPDNGLKGWDYISGYHVKSNQILGFSSTHLSGTGIGDLLDVSLMPFLLETPPDGMSVEETLVEKITNKLKTPALGDRVVVETNLMDLIKSSMTHDEEYASPGYYYVHLAQHGIQVELTATGMTGMQMYSLVNDTVKTKIHLVCLDIFQSYLSSAPKAGHIELVSNNSVQGYKMTQGWASPRHVYFYLDFSQPIVEFIQIGGSKGIKRTTSSHHSTSVGFLVFESIHQLSLRIGISSASTEGAKEAINLHDDMFGWNFMAVKSSTEEEWEKELSKIAVVGEDEDRKAIFYSALYHTMLAPIRHSDAFNNFTGPDKRVHHADDFIYYSTLSIWDTFRAANSLHTLLNPERAKEMIMTLLEHSKYANGKLPVWALWGMETNTMPGYHSVSLLAEAWAKDLINITLLERAYYAMTETEKKFHGINSAHMTRGYVSIEDGPHSGTKTLEYAYDDWCIAQVAAALNLQNETIKYLNRSNFYKNIFDPIQGFMRGRHDNGSFQAPFDPKFSNHEKGVFTEGTSWQYTFFVPHDVKGLVELFNGTGNLESKLDELFFMQNGTTTGNQQSRDISGLIGQYAHGNEPSHHIPYLYNFLGSPLKTQYMVRKIMDEMYSSTPEGLIGNEDCGQMSAWFVFSAMGLYPVNPADAQYHIGIPVFDKIRLNIPPHSLNTFSKDVVFEILAPGASSSQLKFVQNVTLNGRQIRNSLGALSLKYEDIMKGGALEFTLIDASFVVDPWEKAQFKPAASRSMNMTIVP